VSSRTGSGHDALYISKALSAFAGGAAAVELHLFAYLGCLVSIYDGHSADQWHYSFVATPAGAPYSEVLAQETDRLRASGMLLDQGPLLVLSGRGKELLGSLSDLSSGRERAPYLEAACAVASVLPLPTVSHAVAAEPGLQNALHASAPRELLGEADLTLVDEQFGAVTEALAERVPERADLLVPTALWLGYLDARSRQAS
jgi:hypothetical protein